MAVMEKKNLRRTIRITGTVAVVLLLAFLSLFVLNRWSLTITPVAGDTVRVEYGDSYQDAGAEARFHGSILFQTGWPVKCTASGEVDDSTLGSYTVTYSSKLLLWESSVTQTVIVEDTQPPEITLVSDPEHYTLPNHPYEEEGFSALDNHDGDLTEQVAREERDGYVYYSVTDASGNEGTVSRKIKYDDPVPPELTLNGESAVTITAGSEYTEPGWTAIDNLDGDITNQVQVEGSVNKYSAGTYTLTYSVSDTYGNIATVERTVTVEPIRQPDEVTPEGKIVYLTFDDGPGKYTQYLLDVLAKYNVKATFFTVNTGYDSLLAAEAEAGHTVAIHSATHDYSYIYASEANYFEDLQKQQDIICNATGIRTTLVRFPGGSSNTVSKKYCEGIMTQLAKDLTDMGYQYFDWNVLSGDAGETTDTATVAQNVIDGIQKHNVSIVLQHDIKEFSVNAVEQIIVWGLANGYTFLPLTESSPTAHQGINN